MRPRWILIPLLIVLAGGCDFSDRRAVELATAGAQRQAEQNRVVANLGRDMADNQRRIVEAVTASRSELVSLQSELADQRRQLEVERQAIAHDRRMESLLAAFAGPAGWTLLAALPLGLCWLVLADLRRTTSEDVQISQLLVDELMPQDRPPAILDSRAHLARLEPAPGEAEIDPPF